MKNRRRKKNEKRKAIEPEITLSQTKLPFPCRKEKEEIARSKLEIQSLQDDLRKEIIRQVLKLESELDGTPTIQDCQEEIRENRMIDFYALMRKHEFLGKRHNEIMEEAGLKPNRDTSAKYKKMA